jgi:hypothetical protein
VGIASVHLRGGGVDGTGFSHLVLHGRGPPLEAALNDAPSLPRGATS